MVQTGGKKKKGKKKNFITTVNILTLGHLTGVQSPSATKTAGSMVVMTGAVYCFGAEESPAVLVSLWSSSMLSSASSPSSPPWNMSWVHLGLLPPLR